MKGVGRASTVQIIEAVLRVGQRPIGLRAPTVNPHDKERDGWLLFNAVVHVLQPMIEPAELEASQVKRVEACGSAELALWETATQVRVAPGTDDQALVLACLWRPSTFAHPLIVLVRAPQKDIVPPTDVQRRDIHLLVAGTG
jgi:hypothetical protein